jgi:type II secretory pathway component PulJ
VKRDARGFTLIEVLGVVLVTGITIGFATNYYIDLSRASNRASKHTREIRLGTSLLDRIARDFERTLLVDKPEETDPLAHPWLFVGETSEATEGSDLIKFVTRNYEPRRLAEHESDLAVVAYTVHQSEEGDSLELYRWSQPRLPESLDRSFPGPEDEGSVLLADGLASFDVVFYGDDGAPVDNWDSTTLVDSSTLPLAVEIAVSFVDPDDPEADPADARVYRRRVRLPMRPLDLELLFDPSYYASGQAEGEGENGDENNPEGSDSLTVGDCLDINAWVVARNARIAVPEWARKVEASVNQPWNTTKHMFPPEFFAFYSKPTPGCF